MIADDAERLRARLAEQLTDAGYLDDPAWRDAVAVVPRHVFVPGFYLRSETTPTGPDGLPVWEPVTEATDRDRWLRAAYSDRTLITQLDGVEEDWEDPRPRHGGHFTSSATLPSLVATMWADADLGDGMRVLEIGTGTGYSTALACQRLGSKLVTSVEVDGTRLSQAHRSLERCGYTPQLCEADGACGYWPGAPYDRIVAACSMRYVPAPLIGQTSPGGKILLTLSGWLHGSARVLLTADGNGGAEGPLLGGTISFMLVRVHAAPRVSNPDQWAQMTADSASRAAAHSPERIGAATEEGALLRFLAQCAVPNAQQVLPENGYCLVDAVSGSVALIESSDGVPRVRQAGPVRMWDRVEEVIDAYDTAGKPDQTEFRVRVTPQGQYIEHPDTPRLRLVRGVD